MKATIEIEVNKHFGQVYIKFPETGHCCDSVLEPSELEDTDSCEDTQDFMDKCYKVIQKGE